MVDQLSPLEPVLRTGSHGNFADGVGVALSETQPGSIVQVAAWPGEEKALIARHQAGDRPRAARRRRRRRRARRQGGLRLRAGQIPGHRRGRRSRRGLRRQRHRRRPARSPTCRMAAPRIRISGPKAEWVLAKFFAIDFSLPAFPVGSGLLDRPSRHLRADPAHRRRPVRPLRLPLVRPLVLECALSGQRRGRLRGHLACPAAPPPDSEDFDTRWKFNQKLGIAR